MTHLSYYFCLFSDSIIPEKGVALFFNLKNFKNPNNTEFKSINLYKIGLH